MKLSSATWPEVETYLKTKNSIIIPTGSLEQHGPTGLLGTDHMTATAIAERVSELLKIYVAAPICYGMASHHMGFPGTATVRPSVYQAYVGEVLRSFYRHGFRRFYLVNGHGGNTHSLQATFQELKHEGHEGASFYLYNWWSMPELKPMIDELYGDREGHHGTPTEVSLTYYMEGIESRATDAKYDMTPLKAPWPLRGDEFRKLSATGLMWSDPSLARGEHGQRILETSASAISESIRRAAVLE